MKIESIRARCRYLRIQMKLYSDSLKTLETLIKQLEKNYEMISNTSDFPLETSSLKWLLEGYNLDIENYKLERIYILRKLDIIKGEWNNLCFA